MNDTRLTLRAALAGHRLEDFVRQEEARGAALDHGSDFERALALVLVRRALTRNAYRQPERNNVICCLNFPPQKFAA